MLRHMFLSFSLFLLAFMPIKTLAAPIPVDAAHTPGDADSLYKIASPGSYALAGNINGVAGKCGIEIAASNVTLDLAGYRLAYSGTQASKAGIWVTLFGAYGLSIRNGTVFGWKQNGIDAKSAASIELSEVMANGNVGYGICTGGEAILEKCIARVNSTHGIVCESGSILRNCLAASNVQDGIVVTGGIVTDCLASNNGLHGIVAGQGSSLRGCVARANKGRGFSISESSLAECSAYANTNDGIYGDQSRIQDSLSSKNKSNGIQIVNYNSVTDNLCVSNTNAGIWVYVNGTASGGAGNRIEGNQISKCATGIWAYNPSTSNLVLGNFTSGMALGMWISDWNNILAPTARTSTEVKGLNNGLSNLLQP